MSFGDLTTLDDVKAWLSLGGPPGSGQAAMGTVDDYILTRLITSASVFVQSWLNRQLALQDWLEVRDGLAGPYGPYESRFSFAAFPVRAVASVVVAGVTIPAIVQPAPAPSGQSVSAFYSNQAGYSFTPTQLFVRGYFVPRAAQCVRIVYTAGYDPIPFDVAQATLELVALKYRERTRIGERTRSLGGGESVSYTTTAFSLRDFSTDTQTLLEQYRNQSPITGFLTPAATQTEPASLVAVV